MTVYSFKTIQVLHRVHDCSIMSYDVMLMLGGDLQRQWLGEFGAIPMTEVTYAFLISKQILSLVLTLLGDYPRV